MQLGEKTKAPGQQVNPAQFGEAGRNASASRAQIRSLLAPFLNPGDAYVVERFHTPQSRIRSGDRSVVLLSLELPDRSR
jgi:hypothetical protein